MTDWLKPGSPLPQHLARFLFLEDAVPKKRILAVGEPDVALAELLLELGARRVVSAMEDQGQVEGLRKTVRRAGLDFRVLRDGVLPGDDGAFDLVIDFSLPRALARGDAWRLKDIRRILSPDGFALTALANPEVMGLPALFPAQPEGPQIAYRPLAEALHETFDVVQVYFQSLLLGYFFGSFDIDPGDDGIAPNTALMGGSPEPASYYLFAFGNAVPIVEDVSLVQLPLAGMVQAAEASVDDTVEVETELAAVEEEADEEVLEELVAVPELAPPDRGPELEVLQAEIGRRDQAITLLAHRLPELQDQVQGLVGQLVARTEERDRLRVALDQVHVAVDARDAHLEAAATEVRRWRARADELESALSEVVPAEAALLEENELAQLRIQELSALADHLGREREGLRQRAAALAEELAAARRAAGDENLETRRALEQAVAAARASETELKNQLDALISELDQRTRELGTVEAERLRLVAEQERIAGERDRLADVLDGLREERDRLAADVASFDDERHKLADGVNKLISEREHLKEQLAAARHHLGAARTALEEANRQKADDAEAHRRALELEEAVVVERAAGQALKGRIVALESQIHDLTAAFEQRSAEARTLAERADGASQGREDLEARLAEQQERLKAAQARLAERGAELGAAREAFQEAAGQRDTLQQVVAARERALLDVKKELDAAVSSRARLTAELGEQQKALADKERALGEVQAARKADAQKLVAAARQVAEAEQARDQALKTSLERAREIERLSTEIKSGEVQQREVTEEVQDLQRMLSQLKAELARRDAALAERTAELAAGNDLLKVQERDLSVAAQTTQHLRAQLQGQAERISRLEGEKVTVVQALEVAQGALRAERDRTRDLELALDNTSSLAQRSQHEAQRGKQESTSLAQRLEALEAALDEERQNHERTRDNLAATTESLEQLADTGGELEDELLTLRETVERAREREARALEQARLREGQATYSALLKGTLEEAQSALADERARGDLLRESLREAQEALATERSRADLFAAQLYETQHQTGRERTARDLAEASLDEAQRLLVTLGTAVELKDAQLAEAQEAAALEALEADLTHDILDEAQLALAGERARAELLEAHLLEAQEALKEGEARLGLLTSSLDESQRAAADLSQQASRKGRELDEAQASLLDEWARSEQLQQQMKSLQAALTEGRARSSLLSAQLDEAQVEVSAQATRADLLEAQLADARARFEEHRAELDHAADRGHAEHAILRAEVDAAREQLEIAHQREQKDYEEQRRLKRALADAEEAKTTLSARVEQLSARVKELEDTVTQVEHLSEKWEMRALEAQGAVDREIAGMEQRLAEARVALEERDGELADARTARDERLAPLEARVQALEAEVQALEAELEATRAELEVAQQAAEETKRALVAVESMPVALAPVALAPVAVDGLDDEKEALRQRADDLEQQLARLKADLDEKNDRINRLTQRLVSVEGL